MSLRERRGVVGWAVAKGRILGEPIVVVDAVSLVVADGSATMENPSAVEERRKRVRKKGFIARDDAGESLVGPSLAADDMMVDI